MMRVLAYLIPFSLALFFGYSLGSGRDFSKQTARSSFPVVEEKSFAIVIHSYKEVLSCERVLQSIFEQEYENYRVIFFDDASFDGTWEKVLSFILDKNQEERVILMQNDERLGESGCLERAASSLLGQEIVIPLDAKNWLAHPHALSQLNAVYQNPEIWMTIGSSILYPNYQKAIAGALISSETPLSFYANLMDLEEGVPRLERKDYGTCIQKRAKNHFALVDEPLFFFNQGRWRCSFH